jgi:hypothetical protein
MILKLDERPRWDDALLRGEVKRTFQSATAENGCDIAHLEYKGVPLIVSSRDLCLFRHWTTVQAESPEKLSSCRLIAKSVEDDAVPPQSSSVRANLMECGYLMQEGLSENGRYTDVTYISSLDFKGSMPSSLVNLMLRHQPSTLLQMRSLLGKGVAAEPESCNIM